MDNLLKPLIDTWFNNASNYLIENTPNLILDKNPICVIYFTSMAVFCPNTVDAFAESILIKNRFEWYKTRISSASKHIFVRDITKSWYLRGINGACNTVDKLLEFFRQETVGHEVVCVGSSMGGYAALLFAKLLDAKCCFVFSPFLEIEQTVVGDHKYDDLRLLYQNNSMPVYAYFSMESDTDILQEKIFKTINSAHLFLYKFKEHGVYFPSKIVSRIINMSESELKNLYCNKLLTIFDVARILRVNVRTVDGSFRLFPKIKTDQYSDYYFCGFRIYRHYHKKRIS